MRCHGCDEILEEQDPVYCAADFDGLQEERETEVKAARALYEMTAANYERAKAALKDLAELLLRAHENESTADYEAALALARDSQQRVAQRSAGT